MEPGDIFRRVPDAGGAGHAPDCAELRERDVYGAAGNFGRGGGQRGPRGGRGRCGAGAARRLAGAGHWARALCCWRRSRWFGVAEAADRALHAAIRGCWRWGRDCWALWRRLRSSTASRRCRRARCAGWARRALPMLANLVGYWVLGLPLGFLSLLWLAAGDLRTVDRADAGAGGDCAGGAGSMAAGCGTSY